MQIRPTSPKTSIIIKLIHILTNPHIPHTSLFTMSPSTLPAYCIALLSLKSTSELTFAEISTKISKPEVWTTSLFFGQARTDKATAEELLKVLSAEDYQLFG
jgi:hypothetical protein